MSIVFDPFTGQIIDTGTSSGGGGGGSLTIGDPISGATANSVLIADGSLNLNNIQMSTDGQLLIGSTGTFPVAATLTQVSSDQVVITNGPGSISLGLPQDINTTSSPTFANLYITNNGNIDNPSDTGPIDTLVIGATYADIVEIGRAGSKTSIQGTTFYSNATNFELTNKTILLNKYGIGASGNLVGFDIEESGSVTGYVKTSNSRTSWELKAPGNPGVVTIDGGMSGFTIDQGSHDPVTLGSPANGLSLSGQVLSIGLADSSNTGALSSTDWSTFNGKPSLTSSAAQSVSTSNTAGSATDAAKSDHTHRGVASFAKNGSTALYGDVTISASSGITLVQSGNDISIAATTGGGGTVTDVSVVSANGFAGTVANSTTTPAITLTTSITGVLKGNGTAISAALAGTDYQAPITQGNLSETTSSVLTISGGSNAVIGSGTSIQVKQSSSTQSGYLSSTDWSTFNNKEPAITGAATSITSSNLTASRVLTSDASGKVAASSVTDTTLGYLDATSSIQTQLNGKEPTLTKGNLTEATSSVLTISGGSNAVIGSGTSIQVKQSSSSQSGYLSSTDWSTFNGKPNLTSTAAQSVSTSNTAGSATDAAKSDHTHRGVASFAKNGSTALYGDVTISAGTNITLTQSGQDISIAATGGGGSGTVTDVSVVSANGFAGTVANSTTTPAITLTTSISGVLKGNGTAISAATAGTDYEIAQLGSTPGSYPITLTSADNNKVFYMNTTAARTINLPTAASNFKFTIKDVSGQCGTNAITIARNGSESIEGVAANFSCQCDYGIWTFFCDGTNYYLI